MRSYLSGHGCHKIVLVECAALVIMSYVCVKSTYGTFLEHKHYVYADRHVLQPGNEGSGSDLKRMS
jgi:hypothetical protein